ncbi:MAG: tetratricopeptide repeat protein [Crocinitomicaceae bacterium]|nr:tetratricopeptide repeat protein [Crocinitomicaceae bacterium]
MLEDHENNEQDRIMAAVLDFEEVINSNTNKYFDPELLEGIIDYYIFKSDYEKALKCVDFCIEQHPNYMVFQLRKAQICSSLGDVKLSLELLSKVEVLDPNNEEVYLTKASCYSQLKDHERAIKYFEKVLEIAEGDDTLDDVLLDLAIEYQHVGEMYKAIDALKKALMLNPQNETVLYELAYCYDQVNNLEDSIQFYKFYLEDNPYSFTAWFNLGNSYSKMGDFVKAIDAYKFCTSINEDFAPAYFNMATCYNEQERIEEAIESLNECVRVDPEDAQTIGYLGELYEKKEDYNKAIEFYVKAIEMDDQLAAAWFGIGMVKVNLEEFDEAISYILKSLDIEENNSEYWQFLGLCYYKERRFNEAEEAYVRAISADPTNSEALIDFTKIKEEYNKQDALDFLETIVTIYNINDESKAYLVKLYWELGFRTDAMFCFRDLIRTNPNSIKSLFLHFPEAKEIPEFRKCVDGY